MDVVGARRGGWDHGTFGIGEHTVPYLNESLVAQAGGECITSYPDTSTILRAGNSFPLAVQTPRRA